MDQRMRIILVALNRHPDYEKADKIITRHDARTNVVASQLRMAKEKGYVECTIIKSKRWWRITNEGRAAIQ